MFDHNLDKTTGVFVGCAFLRECKRLAMTTGSGGTMPIDGASSKVR